MRVAINLLTEDPEHPSGAHWFWTRVIPEMAKRLESGEELHLLVSPKSRHLYQGYGPGVFYITYPWSNERRTLRTLSEHLYSPLRLPLSRIDVLNTLMAPIVNISWSLVIHMKTMHAFTTPEVDPAFDSRLPQVRVIRDPRGPRTRSSSTPRACASEIEQYLEVDDRKLKLIYEAVDHDLFKPGDAAAARAKVAAYGVTKPFVLFVSSLWPYKNCDGLLRAWALARHELEDRQLAIVGSGRDQEYLASLHSLAAELGISGDVVFVGGVPLEETVNFYRAADAFVYPVPQRDVRASHPGGHGLRLPGRDLRHQRHAGNRGRGRDPGRPQGTGVHRPGHRRRRRDPQRDRLRDAGLRRASQFTWAATGAATLDVYREAAERRRERRK